MAVCAPGLVRADGLCGGLRSLAIWARTLTPTVSFASPDALLLEVQASLRLFGGLASIQSALASQAGQRLSSHRIAIAPTANGALWLSRHGESVSLTLVELRARLRSLPLTVTGWPEPILQRLAEMGISRVGDVLRLPRDGLARRIGRVYLRDLDRALGAEVDLRAALELPRRLTASVDLVPESADRALLIEAASGLLGRVALDLQSCQRQIRELKLRFRHLHDPPSVAIFELLEPAHEQRHFLDLLTYRLERIRLRAPVVAIELETGSLIEMRVAHPELFPGGRVGHDELSVSMIERLRERLGPKNVYGIAVAADHRPETAWMRAAAGREQEHRPLAGPIEDPRIETRPLWLLHVPRRLRVANGRPQYHGALRIETGPERIEGGWWDQRDISRDYFTAVGKSGEKLWIYLDNLTQRWYLHGIFG